MKTIFTALLTLLISQSLIAAEQYQEQKVLYHVNYHEQFRISETLVNVANHLEALGEERVDIKVMMHGKAVEYLIEAVKDEGKQMQLDSLRMSGVQFLVCGNTLNGYNITLDDLYEVEAEDMVQAGLPAIVDLQQKGYIYVRP
ncbi:DsrE family protein [Amphritea sp. HPY]|uniref:DsrE family protein n=1 Tax=Amphritea sp. HPY TaxID=3421652 RepID=UPI003D7D8A1E